jgi:hypothetical protein
MADKLRMNANKSQKTKSEPRMDQPRNGEWANGRTGEAADWWGEAPERSGTSSKEISVVSLNVRLGPKMRRAVT